MNANDTMRLSRCEAVCNQLRSQMRDVLWQTYESAVNYADAELAAATARAIRNQMLVESDNECTLDRILTDAPNSEAFEDWLPWLIAIATHKNNDWGAYRQHLRDITKQPGFPFEIDWGARPEID